MEEPGAPTSITKVKNPPKITNQKARAQGTKVTNVQNGQGKSGGGVGQKFNENDKPRENNKSTSRGSRNKKYKCLKRTRAEGGAQI